MSNSNEIFNKYAKFYIAHADQSLMNFNDFNEALGEILSLPVDGLVMPKMRQAIKEITAKSYLANDVWDDTNGIRKYQNISMPTVELSMVIEILEKHFSA